MVWKYFVRPVQESGLDIDLSGGILIHSGGWKKLQEEAVGNTEFKATVREVTGLERIHNFYGMVEQVVEHGIASLRTAGKQKAPDQIGRAHV